MVCQDECIGQTGIMLFAGSVHKINHENAFAVLGDADVLDAIELVREGDEQLVGTWPRVEMALEDLQHARPINR
ncbi:hypothetical protein GCM10009604_22540 [Corynebacterium aurimucosum]